MDTGLGLLYSGEDCETNYRTLGYIEAGNQFGEYACLTKEPRTATVVAETFTELYSLSRCALAEVMERWPEYHAHITEKMMQQSRAAKDERKKGKSSKLSPEKILGCTKARLLWIWKYAI